MKPAYRRLVVALAASGLVAALAPAAPAGDATTQLIADGSALAFTLRPTYDSGGGAPLHFYLGFTEANLSTPPESADGQASWYNFGIAETAAFKPPEDCTPEKNFARTQQGLADAADWVQDEVIPAFQQGRQPVAPGPTLPCTERLAGFSQSRYPATRTIKESSSDDLHTGIGVATGGVVRDGAFSARATAAPSQRSEAVTAGLAIPQLVSVGAARTLSSVGLTGDTLVSEAVSVLDDVCVGPAASGCAVAIDHLEFTARVERRPGAKPKVSSRVTLGSINGTSVDAQLEQYLSQVGYSYDPNFAFRLVSTTGNCGGGKEVADSGGLFLFGKGSSGGGIMVGGACANGRLDAVSLLPPIAIAAPPIPPSSFAVPGVDVGTTVLGVQVAEPGGPTIVTKQVRSVIVRRAPAWRTAPYWVTTLAALLLAGALLAVFRRSRYVSPVWTHLDRFARQFVRG